MAASVAVLHCAKGLLLAEHGSTVISARAMTGACETTALPPNSEVPGKAALIQPILKSRDYHAPDDT
jgi:hypothetical protein